MHPSALLLFVVAASSAVKLEVYNKCPFPIWPGIQGSTLVANGGFKLESGQLRAVDVPDKWSKGRIWARTGCDGNFNCDSGFCGNKLECEGRGGVPPVSLAEFTLNGNGDQDFYDVSMVDGYNLPVFIEPLPGTYRTNGGPYDCKRAGGCFKDLNDPNICPSELRKNNGQGRTVGCKSACVAFNSDNYCCRGYHNKPETCKRSHYADIFKDACPGAYSFAYDDKSSTFFCRGQNSKSPDYRIQFC